jgi:hypothetical protein
LRVGGDSPARNRLLRPALYSRKFLKRLIVAVISSCFTFLEVGVTISNHAGDASNRCAGRPYEYFWTHLFLTLAM